MEIVLSARRGRALRALTLLLALSSALPAEAQSLFARHNVTVEFAAADGKPIADAEVRVFAPGRPNQPALTGRTDRTGHFEFAADQDGLWSAEARSGGEIARVTVRVGGQPVADPISPYWLIGGLLALLILAFAYRTMRARARRPTNTD